jgi:hypothetical protein
MMPLSIEHESNKEPLSFSFLLRSISLLVVLVVTSLFLIAPYYQTSFMQQHNTEVSTALKETTTLIGNSTIYLSSIVERWRQGLPIMNASLLELLQRTGTGPDCDCASSNEPTCCLRSVIVFHKMGHVVTDELFGACVFMVNIAFKSVRPHQMPLTPDYRSVLVLRNIWTALASGYLYHKRGMECWLDPYGEPRPNNRLQNTDWQNYFTAKNDTALTLCHYLRDQPEALGMRAYMEFIFRRKGGYRGLCIDLAIMNNVEIVKEKSMLVCYEDLLKTPKDTFDRMLHFLYPSNTKETHSNSNDGKSDDQPEGDVPVSTPSLLGQCYQTARTRVDSAFTGQDHYTGAHATNHDPELRSRLVALAKQIDAKFFNSQVAFLDTMIPCR